MMTPEAGPDITVFTASPTRLAETVATAVAIHYEQAALKIPPTLQLRRKLFQITFKES